MIFETRFKIRTVLFTFIFSTRSNGYSCIKNEIHIFIEIQLNFYFSPLIYLVVKLLQHTLLIANEAHSIHVYAHSQLNTKCEKTFKADQSIRTQN